MMYQSPIQKMIEQSEIDEMIGIPDKDWEGISGLGAELLIEDKEILNELTFGMSWIDRMNLLNELQQHKKLYVTVSAMKDGTVSMLLNTRNYDDIEIALTEDEMITVREKLVDNFNQQYKIVLNEPITLQICILHLQEIQTEYQKAIVEDALSHAPIQSGNNVSLHIEDALTLEEFARRMDDEVMVLAKLRFDANKPIDFIVCTKEVNHFFLEVDDSNPNFYSKYSLDDEKILCHYQIILSETEQQILSERLKTPANRRGGFYHE